MMTTDQALQFLADHQPMPSDKDATDSDFVLYGKVRHFFEELPDSRCIPLFLGSFGEGNGRGHYQLVEDVFRRFDAEQVLQHLCAALERGNSANRYWVMQIASDFPSEVLIPSLGKCLEDEDVSVRYMTVVCLEQIPGKRSSDELRTHRNIESDTEIVELIDEVLATRE